MKKNMFFKILLAVAIAVMIVLAFLIVVRKMPSKTNNKVEVSEVSELVHMDISKNYPSTPREVLRLYNRYMLAIYGTDRDDISENDFKRLASRMRDLYDEELLEINPESAYISALRLETDTFKADNKVMLKTNVCASVDFEFFDRDGYEYSLGTADYFVKQNSDKFDRTYEEYLFRKDSEGHWKILAFQQTNGE